QIEGAPLQIECANVLDRLKARDGDGAVAHAHVSRDGADLRGSEVANELLDGSRSHDSVRVDRHKNVMPSQTERGVERRDLPGLGLTMDPDARVAGKSALDEVGGPIGRPIVDDDDFETPVPVFDDGTERANDQRGFVVSGNEHRNRRMEGGIKAPSLRVPLLSYRQ